jgi:hypothetical protein
VERIPPKAAAERPVEFGYAKRQHRPALARREELPRRDRVGLGAEGRRAGGRVLRAILRPRPALDLGNAAGELGKSLSRHESACAHGL